MNDDAIEIRGLIKNYPRFTLGPLTLTVPRGAIYGPIGPNGAGYVSPDLNFQVWGNVGRAVRFVRGFFPDWDDHYCDNLMRAFHLDSGEKISTLSFGAKTKLSLLLALSHHPEVLILDEPTTGLDAVSKQQVFAELLKAVEEGDGTVLISSHRRNRRALPFVGLCFGKARVRLPARILDRQAKRQPRSRLNGPAARIGLECKRKGTAGARERRANC